MRSEEEGRGPGITAKVAKSWPVTWRQEWQWQRADLSGKAEVGSVKVWLNAEQWQVAVKVVVVAMLDMDI